MKKNDLKFQLQNMQIWKYFDFLQMLEILTLQSTPESYPYACALYIQTSLITPSEIPPFLPSTI